MNIFDKDPDFINNIGMKYWYNDEVADYCCSKGLTNYISWDILYPSKKRTIVLINNTSNKILGEFSNLQEIFLFIDTLK